MGPDQRALPVGLAGDRCDFASRQVGVDLDRGRPGPVRLGDGERQVRAGRRNGLHRGNGARLFSTGRGLGAGILEERRTSRQRGVIDVRPGDLADPGGARDVGQPARVAGHVPHRGDPAIEVAAHHCFGPGAR
jgi:hypothetical protein